MQPASHVASGGHRSDASTAEGPAWRLGKHLGPRSGYAARLDARERISSRPSGLRSGSSYAYSRLLWCRPIHQSSRQGSYWNRSSSRPSTLRSCSLHITCQEEVASLLVAAWSDAIDFYFTPTPKQYHLFADHDEYTTIFGATKGQVAKVATALANAEFSRIDGYVRHW